MTKHLTAAQRHLAEAEARQKAPYDELGAATQAQQLRELTAATRELVKHAAHEEESR